MSNTRLLKALFPDLPRNLQVIDKNGEMTPVWNLFFEQLAISLQTHFKPEGTVIPSTSSTNISLLTGNNSANNVIYDNSNNAFNGNITNPAITANDPTANAQKWVQFAMILDNSGNPNTTGNVVPGIKNQLCWDSLNHIMYICTQSGDGTDNPTKAMWTAI